MIFSTIALLRLDSSFYTGVEKPAPSVKMVLSSAPDSFIYFTQQQNKINGKKTGINLYYLLETVKADLAKGEYKKAENNLKNLLLFYPNNRTVLSLLGGVLYSTGNYRQAQNMFELMIKNNPDDSLGRESMGLVLEKQKKYTQAIEEFLHASL